MACTAAASTSCIREGYLPGKPPPVKDASSTLVWKREIVKFIHSSLTVIFTPRKGAQHCAAHQGVLMKRAVRSPEKEQCSICMHQWCYNYLFNFESLLFLRFFNMASGLNLAMIRVIVQNANISAAERQLSDSEVDRTKVHSPQQRRTSHPPRWQ